MRMRKIPWAEDFLEQADVVIKNPETMAGKWKDVLNKPVIHLEIGCGKGDYWTKMAQQYPAYGWIGIEMNPSVAALAIRKYTQIDNEKDHMRFICADAKDLVSWFDKGEVQVLHLNFSDPWPKKRAHKKRLSNVKFIEQYKTILSDDGEIQMKTDNVALFEYSVIEFQNAGWFMHEFSVDYRRIVHDEDVITEYEQRFMDKGQPIFRAVWRKYC